MIRELKQRRAALLARLREIVESAETEDRDLSGEETEEYQRTEQEFDRLSARIARLEALDSNQDNPATQPTEGREVEETAETREITLASDEYRDAFEALARARGRRDHLSEEQRAALQVGTDSEGGYTVPDEFLRQLVEAEREFSVMRELATTITTAESGELLIPGVDTRASAEWTAEEVAFTQSEDTFKQIKLGAFKVGALAKVSDELLHDSAFDILGFLARSLGEAIGLKEGEAFVNGASGSVTTPEGIVNKATVGFTGAVAAKAVVATDDLLETYHSLLSPYRVRANWLFNDGTAKAIRLLKDADNQYLWQPGLQAGQPDILLGRPVRIDPHVPAIGVSAKSIVFGDVAGYYIRDVEGVTVKVLNELYAANGQVGFRIHRRTDGDLVDTATVRVFKHGAAA